MAKKIPDEEIQLRKRARRRLVGAIALVIIVAVVLPMVLDSEPKPVSHDVTIQIPSKDEGGKFGPKVAPASDAVKGDSAPSSDGTSAAGAAPSGTAGTPAVIPPPVLEDQSAKKSGESDGSKPDGKSAKDVAVTGTGSTGSKSDKESFVVQLAALSSMANVKQLQEKLTSSGIKSYTEVLKTDAGDRIRVRAGPYTTREAAEKVRDRIKQMGINAIVTSG